MNINKPATSWVPGVLLSTLIVVLYIELVVPGIPLTTPAHNDVFQYSYAWDAIPFWKLLRGPRPIGWLALKLGGALPWSAMMWTLSLVGIAASMAPLVVYSLLLKRTIPIPGMILWSLLVVSYPAMYLGLVHDLGSRLALLFASIGVFWYATYFQRKDSCHLALACLFSLAGFLSKETFGPMQIVTVAYIGLLSRANTRDIVTAAGTVVLALVAALLHARWAGSPFVSGTGSYAIDLNPFNVLRTWAGFTALALTPQLLACLAGILAYLGWRRDWSAASACAVAAAICLLSLLPNAILTKHGGCNYEMILVPLMATLIVATMDYQGLFTTLERAIPLALCGLAVTGVVWGEHELAKSYWWQMGIARFNQNAIRSLRLFGDEVRAADKVAVLGLQHNHVVQPWTPFTQSHYLCETLGFPTTSFTIVSPAYAEMEGPAVSADGTRSFVPGLETAWKERADMVMAFGADGAIRRIITDRGRIDRILSATSLDVTRLSDATYWASEVEPLLLEPDPAPREDSVSQGIEPQLGDPQVRGIALFFKGMWPGTRVIGVGDGESGGPSRARRWLPVRYETITDYAGKTPGIMASAEALKQHLIKADDVAYVIAPMAATSPPEKLVHSALDEVVAMGLAEVSYKDEHFQVWLLLKKHRETIPLAGGGTASIAYDAKQLCKQPAHGVVTVSWSNATGGVAVEVKSPESSEPRLWVAGGDSGIATTGPWVPIGGELIFRKGHDGEVLGRVKVTPDCPKSR